MPSNEGYYYAAYAVAMAVYVVYALSLHLRRRAIRDRAGHG